MLPPDYKKKQFIVYISNETMASVAFYCQTLSFISSWTEHWSVFNIYKEFMTFGNYNNLTNINPW